MYRLWLLLIALLLPASASANELLRSLETIYAFPVNVQINDSKDLPITAIDTGVIKDSDGNVARGPHDVIFTLDAASNVGVNVNGNDVAPGESVTMVINLTGTAHRLSLPVFPLSTDAIGSLDYKLEIPRLNVNICPAGFDERTDDCYRIDFEEINYICPNNYNYTHGLDQCERLNTVELITACPEGYAQNENECTLYETANYENVCNTGFSFQNGRCEKLSVEQTSICPAGSSLTSNGRCQEITNIRPASYPCPAGGYSSGGSCRMETYTSPTSYTCPSSHPGQSSYGDMCYRLESERYGSGSEGCSPGYSVTPGNRCAQYTSATPICPAGFSNAGNNLCVSSYTMTQGYYCGTTKSDSPQCLTYRYHSTGTYCPSGFSLNRATGSCERLETRSVQKVCPDRFSLTSNGTMCERTLQVNLDISCPANFERSDNGEFCEEKRTQEASIFCPEGGNWVRNGYECNRVLEDTVASCPSGYALRENGCHEVKDARKTCPAYYTLNEDESQCIRQESTSQNTRCPTGRYNAELNMCEDSHNPTHPTMQCPNNYNYDPYSGQCYRTIPEWVGSRTDSDQHPGCPDGGALTTGGPPYESWHFYCNRTYYVNPIDPPECEVGKILNPDTLMCEYEFTYHPLPACNDGWTEASNQCTRDVFADPSNQCDTNWSRLDTEMCYNTQRTQAVGQCSSGYTYNAGSGLCERSETREVIYECPSDSRWTLNAPSCNYYDTDDLIIRCPEGYSIDDSLESCSKVYTEEPVYSCEEGFTLDLEARNCFRERIVPHL